MVTQVENAPSLQEDAVILEELEGAEIRQDPDVLGQEPFEKTTLGTTTIQAEGSDVESAGLVTMYLTETGDPSVTNRNMLANHLRKRRPDGQRMWTTLDPGIRPPKGTHKCRLHADHPDMKAFPELGIAPCRKSNLASEFEVGEHGRKKHRREWAALEDAAVRQRERELLQFQRDQQKFMNSAFENHTPQVSEAVDEPVSTHTPEVAKEIPEGFGTVTMLVKKCDVCDKEYIGPDKGKLNVQMSGHTNGHRTRGEMPPAKE